MALLFGFFKFKIVIQTRNQKPGRGCWQADRARCTECALCAIEGLVGESTMHKLINAVREDPATTTWNSIHDSQGWEDHVLQDPKVIQEPRTSILRGCGDGVCLCKDHTHSCDIFMDEDLSSTDSSDWTKGLHAREKREHVPQTKQHQNGRRAATASGQDNNIPFR